MSRSYHVTNKSAHEAISLGDTAPAFLAGEKHWVKTNAKKSRKTGVPVSNRAIVAIEKRKTTSRKANSEPAYTFAGGFAGRRKKL